MATIGRAYVELRGITNKLERDIEKALKPGVKKITNEVTKEISSSIKKGFSDIKASDIDIDVTGVGARAAKKIREDIEFHLGKPIDTSLNINDAAADESAENLIARIRGRFAAAGFAVPSPQFNSDDFNIEPKIDDSSMEEVRHRMDDLKDDYQEIEAEIHPDTDSASSEFVSARLKWLTRPRFVMIHAVMNNNSLMKVAEAISAIAGVRMATNVLSDIWEMVENLDKSIPKITLFGSAITYVTGFVTTLAADVFALAVDLGRLAGLLIPLPGILGGMAIGLGATVAVFKDFTSIFPQLLTDLDMLQDGMSQVFWTQAKAPFQDFINNIFPEFSKGIMETSRVLGVAFGNLASSLKRELVGEMTPMFDNLNTSILVTAAYTDQYAGIIQKLGEHGSEYLPRLADWFGQISTRFNNFLAEAEASGELDAWTNNAIANLGYLGDAIWGVGRIFYELGTIAEEAGGARLRTFAEGLNGIADVIGREPFRSNLLNVFQSAHEMISTINRTSGPAVVSFFERLAEVAAEVFDIMGPALGVAIRELATALASPEFSGGFIEFVQGIADGMIAISEALVPAGAGLGALGSAIGTMAREFGPILANVLVAVADTLVAIGPAIEGVIVILAGLVQAFTSLPSFITGPLILIAGALTGLLGPAGALNAVMGLTSLTFGKVAAGARGSLGAISAFTANMNGMTRAMGAFAAVAVIQGIADMAIRAQVAKVDIEQLSEELSDLADGASEVGPALAAIFQKGANWSPFRTEIKSTEDAVKSFADSAREALADNFWENFDRFSGFGMDMAKFEEQVTQLDAAFAEMVASGDVDGAAEMYAAFTKAAEEQGVAIEDLEGHFPAYNAALEQNAAAMDEAKAAAEAEAEAQRQVQEAHNRTAAAVDAQVGSLEQLIGLQRKAAGEILTTREAQRGLEQAFDDAAKAIETNGKTWDATANMMDRTTEAGRANESALDDIADSALNLAESMAKSGEGTAAINERMEAARSQFIKTAEGMGVPTEAAKALADQMGLIPEKVATDVTANTDVARLEIDGFLLEMNRKTGEITFKGNSVPAEETLGNLIGDVNESDGTVDINGTAFPAEMTVAEFLASAGATPATVPVNAETGEANTDLMLLRGAQAANPLAIPVNADILTPAQEMQMMRDRERGRPIDMPVTADTATAKSDIEGVKTTTYNNPAQIRLSANTGEITQAVAGMKQTIANSPPATLQIGANTTFAQVALGEMKAVTNGTTATMRLALNPAMANTTRAGVVRAISSTTATFKLAANASMANTTRTGILRSIGNTTATFKIAANPGMANTTRGALVRGISSTTATMKIAANAGRAQATLNSFVAAANRRTATVTVYTRTVQQNAIGGINPPRGLTAFANGGFSGKENHVAQIARGGLTRIWAEPETGGEAYIPLALSKRLRSLKILEQVAAIMGMSVIPQNTKMFAKGGILTRRDISLLAQRPTPTANIASRTGSVAAPAPVKPQIINNFTINTTGEVDVDGLAREVSRQIMWNMS
jgi:hypothetical protein